MLYYVRKEELVIHRYHIIRNVPFYYLTKPIVLSCHNRVKHNGLRHTLSEVRSLHWITKGKSYVKNILYHCTACRRFNGRPYAYHVSPDLLKLQVNIDYAFSGVGIDYMDPLYCKNIYVNDLEDDEIHKYYGILYTCPATRDVVLDVVTDAHADTLFLSLTRYISRRGRPKQVLTDNGPVFASSKAQLFAAQRNIKWIFNPEEAPWFGSFWERFVGSVKRCIKKTTGRICLTFTENIGNIIF